MRAAKAAMYQNHTHAGADHVVIVMMMMMILMTMMMMTKMTMTMMPGWVCMMDDSRGSVEKIKRL